MAIPHRWAAALLSVRIDGDPPPGSWWAVVTGSYSLLQHPISSGKELISQPMEPALADVPAKSPEIRRRGFLKRLAAALGAFLATAVGIPLVGAAVSPGARRDEPHWITVGAVADFAQSAPRLVTFGITKADGYSRTTAPRAVWVHRTPAGGLVVYNARCTHLGCLVSYQPDSQTFLSPCHGGVFALRDGAVLEGPPPRPLDRLDHREEGGQLMVQYRDFVVGVTHQVPL